MSCEVASLENDPSNERTGKISPFSTTLDKVNPAWSRLAQIICLILHLLKPLEPKQSAAQNQRMETILH